MGLCRQKESSSWHKLVQNKKAPLPNQVETPWFRLAGPSDHDSSNLTYPAVTKRCSPPTHFEFVIVGAALVIINSDDCGVVVIATGLFQQRNLSTTFPLLDFHSDVCSGQRTRKAGVLVVSWCSPSFDRSSSGSLNPQLDVVVNPAPPVHAARTAVGSIVATF